MFVWHASVAAPTRFASVPNTPSDWTMSDGRDASLTSGDSQSRSAPDLGQSSRPARPIKGAWAAMKPVSSSSTTLEADESDRSQQRDIYSEALSPWLPSLIHI